MMRSILPRAKGWMLIKTILVVVFTAVAVPEPPHQSRSFSGLRGATDRI